MGSGTDERIPVQYARSAWPYSHMPPWPSSSVCWVSSAAAPYQSAAISGVTRAAVCAGSSLATRQGRSSQFQ